MIKELVLTRKYAGENYYYYLNKPEYTGETGVCGMPITPYISCITPENSFGYTDTVLLNTDNEGNKTAYTLHRYLQPWILKKIEKKMILLENKYC